MQIFGIQYQIAKRSLKIETDELKGNIFLNLFMFIHGISDGSTNI